MSVDATTNTRNAIPPSQRFLLSEDDGSCMMGVSKPTFRKWVAGGLIRPVEMPCGERRRLYRRADLEQFAASLAARR
jgi:excisionase family DNA binding protein